MSTPTINYTAPNPRLVLVVRRDGFQKTVSEEDLNSLRGQRLLPEEIASIEGPKDMVDILVCGWLATAIDPMAKVAAAKKVRKCENCRFSEKPLAIPYGIECRRHSPVVIVIMPTENNTGHRDRAFPVVSPTDCCGDFFPKDGES